MTTAGKLDRIVTFQRAVVSYNAFNEQIETWELLVKVSGGKRDASSSEGFRAQEVGAQLTTRFMVRRVPALADLNPRDRVIFDGKIYNITGVREPADTRNAWLELDAVVRDDEPATVTSP
jgi:SPP1 family predicted phage head-tail adaptor